MLLGFLASPLAMTFKNCRYTEVINLRFPHCGIASLAQVSTLGLCPLQYEKGKRTAKVLRRFRCYARTTHPAGAGSTLKGKRKRKSGHKRRAKGQNSAGGEGNKRTSRTNLHGETDLTNTEHTPKPHDTLQRGTGEN